MSLHKTDYLHIAAAVRDVLRESTTQEQRECVQRVAAALADLFAIESRAFNKGLFMTNCGFPLRGNP